MRPRPRSIPTGFLLLVLATVGGCSDGPATVPLDDVPEAFRTATVPGTGWTLVERPGFSFRLPPDFFDAGLQPIDSDAARYVRGDGGAALYFDYGPYTGRTRAPDGATGVREVWTTIGGRTVQLVAWGDQDGRVVVGWWPDLDRRHGMDDHLRLGGSWTDPSARDDVIAAIRSVRFP